MRDMIPGFLMALVGLIMVINIGAMIHRTIYESKLLKRCTEKKEFILDNTVVRCEIVKDLR